MAAVRTIPDIAAYCRSAVWVAIHASMEKAQVLATICAAVHGWCVTRAKQVHLSSQDMEVVGRRGAVDNLPVDALGG